MKKFLSLALALMLLMSSFLLVACDVNVNIDDLMSTTAATTEATTEATTAATTAATTEATTAATTVATTPATTPVTTPATRPATTPATTAPATTATKPAETTEATPVVTAPPTTNAAPDLGGDQGGATPTEKPVKVDKVNGMTAQEAYRNFYQEYYKNETAIDIQIIANFEEESDQEFLTMKIGEDCLYMLSNMGSRVEYWLVDGVLYMNAGSEKLKVTDASMEDKELFYSNVILPMKTVIFVGKDMESFIETLADAELYFANGEYYCEVSYSMSEGDNASNEAEILNETIYFDKQGKVKKLVMEEASTKEMVTIIINSYGEPVSISAPEDADSYIEEVLGGGGETTNMPKEYKAVIDALDSAKVYKLSVSVDSGESMSYATDGINEELSQGNEDGIVYKWYIDGEGYVEYIGGDIESVEVDEDFLFHFEVFSYYRASIVEMLKEMPIDDKIDISMNKYDGVTQILFVIADEEYGTEDNYIIEYSEEMTYVSIIVVSAQDGEIFETVKYKFSYINSDSYKIELPKF